MTRVSYILSNITSGDHSEWVHVHHSQILQCSVLFPPTHHSETEDNRYIYHSDHLGSSAFLTDAEGNPTQHLQYLPFGEPFIEQRSVTEYYTPYTFSAKERDLETGYSYFGARYYSSTLSVWLSVDPKSDRGSSISPYAYAFHNPLGFVDPDGEWARPKTAYDAGVVRKAWWAFRLLFTDRISVKLQRREGEEGRRNYSKHTIQKVPWKRREVCDGCPRANFGKGNTTNSTHLSDEPTDNGSVNWHLSSGRSRNDYPFTGVSLDNHGDLQSLQLLEEHRTETGDKYSIFTADIRNALGLSIDAQPSLDSDGNLIDKRSGTMVYRKPDGLNIGDLVIDMPNGTKVIRPPSERSRLPEQDVTNDIQF